MTRTEIEKAIEPVIAKCQRLFGESSGSEAPTAAIPCDQQSLRPDVRRVSLIISMTKRILDDGVTGDALEIGSGFGYLLFPMARFFPGLRWSATEHPDRRYVNRQDYLGMFGEYKCELSTTDIVHAPLPFPDGAFSLVTFSEVLEHLPVERLNFIISEIKRVIHPGGILIVSSPNQASLENRLLLLKGKSILAMPDETEYAKGTFGHIRLYTTAEIQSAMEKAGFTLELSVIESNNAEYRGTSDRSWQRRLYRRYERIEQKLGFLRGMGDTWYTVFRKSGE